MYFWNIFLYRLLSMKVVKVNVGCVQKLYKNWEVYIYLVNGEQDIEFYF